MCRVCRILAGDCSLLEAEVGSVARVAVDETARGLAAAESGDVIVSWIGTIAVGGEIEVGLEIVPGLGAVAVIEA